MHRQLSCGIVFVLAITACSSDNGGGSPTCPPCAQGTVCNPSTGQCVAEASCPQGTACGANAVCNTASTCACTLGWTDCNGDLLSASGDGCECDKACDGSVCGTSSSCQPTVARACGGESMYCDGASCQPCPAGRFNCDGLADCESSQACQPAPGCKADVANSCGNTAQYCEAGACTTCPAGKTNCDGTGPCECDQGCDGTSCASTPPPDPCDPACTRLFEFFCVKNSKGFCQACDGNDDHCKGNPRANGPTCVNSFCVCEVDGDCSGRTTGPFCRQSGSVKKCACDTAADCQAPYTLCLGLDASGKLAKQCQKPCANDADCVKAGTQGTCDTATGLCKFP